MDSKRLTQQAYELYYVISVHLNCMSEHSDRKARLHYLAPKAFSRYRRRLAANCNSVSI